MRYATLLLLLALCLATPGRAQFSFLWLQFLPPVDETGDLPDCEEGSFEEDRARVVRSPSPTIYYCPDGGGSWVQVTGSDDQTAAEVSFTPAGGIAATDVQAALVEVDAEHTVDTDTTCLDAGVACLFAASSSEGGAATSALDLSCADCIGDTEVTTHAGTSLAADLEEETHATEHSLGGTDAVTATDLASSCTDAQVLGGTAAGTGVECQADDDVPESGDFGAAVDLESDGSLSADVVAAAEMADADHGDVSWSGGVASVDDEAIAATELADATDGSILTWDASGEAVLLGPGTSGQVLTTGGAGAAPTWEDAAGGGGAATGVDLDGDSTLEISGTSGTNITFDPTDDGSADWTMTSTEFVSPESTDVFIGAGDTGWRLRDANTSIGGVHFVRQGESKFQMRANGANSMSGYAWGDNNQRFLSLGGTTIYFGLLQGDAQSVTCTDSGDGNPGTLVITPSTSYVELTNADAHGCSVTLSETGAAKGRITEVRVISTAGGTVDFADAAGVQELPATCSLNLYGTATFRYLSDRWAQGYCTTF